MNLRLILATAGLLFGAPAFAGEWQTVASSEEETVLVDTRSVKADGDEVRVRVVRDYRDAQLSFANSELQPYRSQVMIYAVDCMAREVRYVEWGLYSANLGQGSKVAQGKPRGAVYSRTLSLSGEAAMLKTVCEQPIITDAPKTIVAHEENL